MDFFPRLCQKSWFVMKKTLLLIALFAGAAWTMAAAQSPAPSPTPSPAPDAAAEYLRLLAGARDAWAAGGFDVLH